MDSLIYLGFALSILFATVVAIVDMIQTEKIYRQKNKR